MIKRFLLALQFLTTIPVKFRTVQEKEMQESAIYFPLVGLFLGLILVVTDYLLSFINFTLILVSVILIILLIILTGGLHLDGLADTFDAFLSRKNKEETLRIMQDSHIGTMGGLAIISIILLKIALLYSIGVLLRPLALVLMCILSRWSLVLAMFLFNYARQEGKAKVFIQGMNLKIFILATIIALVSALVIWKIKGLMIMIIVALVTYLTGKVISNKIGGITGDILGAMNEIAEVVILLSIYILKAANLWII